MSSNRVTFEIKINVHVFTESTWIIIAIGFGISKGFEDRVWLQKDIFHPGEIKTKLNKIALNAWKIIKIDFCYGSSKCLLCQGSNQVDTLLNIRERVPKDLSYLNKW